MPTAKIFLSGFAMSSVARAVTFATNDRFKQMFFFFMYFPGQFFYPFIFLFRRICLSE
jgi:hypothetical protein